MSSAVELHQVRPETAVDLRDEKWLRQAKIRRARAAFAEQVEAEVQHLAGRVSFLQRKALRLPRGNGRRKAELEAVRLQALALLLPIALSGKPILELPEAGGRHAQRAVRLLNDIASAAQDS
jgi:hypothetical protein